MSFASWLNEQYEERGPMKWLAFLLELIASITLFAMMVLTCVDVIGRYFLHHPVLGATELTEIFLAIVLFSAMPIITWRGGQIVVDLIDNFVTAMMLRVMMAISTVLIATSMYFVAFRIFELGARNLKRGITTDFLFIPTGYVVQAIAIFSWITVIGLLITTLMNLFSSKSLSAAKKPMHAGGQTITADESADTLSNSHQAGSNK